MNTEKTPTVQEVNATEEVAIVDLNSLPVADRSKLSSFYNYIEDIKGYRVLTKEEEVVFATTYRTNKDPAAREKLILHNTKLVISIAVQYSAFHDDILDLVQEGNLGLMRAIETFNPEFGYKFSTYATWWIKQHIRRFLDSNDLIRIPVHLKEFLMTCSSASTFLTQILRRTPTSAELCDYLDIPEAKYLKYKVMTQGAVSFNTVVGEDEDTALMDLIADPNAVDPSEYVAHQGKGEIITRVLQNFTAKEQFIITKRFGLDGRPPMTLVEIGEILNITRERVRQIEEKVLSRLANNPLLKSLVNY